VSSITGEPLYEIVPRKVVRLLVDSYRFTGAILWSDGVEYCAGIANVVSPSEVLITELPLMELSAPYCKGLLKIDEESGEPKHPEIVDVIDESGGNTIKITVKFEEGAIQRINSKQASIGRQHKVPGIYGYLGLVKPLTANLNFIGTDNVVNEFNSYAHVFDRWFEIRKELYRKKYSRKRTMLLLQIEMKENIINFIKLKAKLSELSLDEQEAICEKNGLVRLCENVVREPRFLPVDKISEIAHGLHGSVVTPSWWEEMGFDRSQTASYDYLLDLSTKQLSQQALIKRSAELFRLQVELKELSLDTEAGVAKLWLNDLSALEREIKKGRINNWDTDTM
jgi:hypothetical protein